MAVQSSDSGGSSSRRRGGMGRGMMGLFAGHYVLKRMIHFFISAIIVLFAIFALFGGIHQVQTGQSIIDWGMELAQEMGNAANAIFTGEGDTPIRVTDAGVYIDGHQPEGSEDLIDSLQSDGSGGSDKSDK